MLSESLPIDDNMYGRLYFDGKQKTLYCFLALAFPSGRAPDLLLDSSFKVSSEEPIPPDHVRPSGEMEDAEPVKGSHHRSDFDMAHAAEAAAEAEVDVVAPRT
ncbi:hypothetical protein BHE74_00006735 [Ensete ventricosum]|nr:hypothetical protein BHE74_00006735 [Ensete ventricosum]